MREWKELAIEKLGLRPSANDRVVLDEIIRVEIRGGSTILRIRDRFATWSQEQIELGQITQDESSSAMAGIIAIVQNMRARARGIYEAYEEFDENVACELDEEEDYQPAADYEDPKGES